MQLLLIGASVRAAAQSARRAGCAVIASDLFGDRDLRAIADFHACPHYPESFRTLRERLPGIPIVYTGALENYPQLLQALEQQGPVYGNPAATVAALRDPFRLSAAFAKQGIPFPETSRVAPHGDDDQDWIVKPVRSAGGNRVQSWRPPAEDNSGSHAGSNLDSDENSQAIQPRKAASVFQRRVCGHPVSATFVASPGQRAVLLGATTMLVGRSWGGPGEFTYCGSVAERLDPDRIAQWQQIATAVGDEFSLCGVFGIDAIQQRTGASGHRLVPIEVNPRYTASMEVLEPSLPHPILAYHIAACQQSPLPPPTGMPYVPRAKRIIYAQKTLQVPSQVPTSPDIQLADVPGAGQQILAGQPILTMIADHLDHIQPSLVDPYAGIDKRSMGS